jgi:hypothetical protein
MKISSLMKIMEEMVVEVVVEVVVVVEEMVVVVVVVVVVDVVDQVPVALILEELETMLMALDLLLVLDNQIKINN